AVSPDILIKRSMAPNSANGRRIRRSISDAAAVYVLSVGKAAPGMLAAFTKEVSRRIDAALVVAPHGAAIPEIHSVHPEVIRAGHPFPNRESARAGKAALALARQVRDGDVLIALISG